jgi:aspartate/methionine/tyrosine aminotransferase
MALVELAEAKRYAGVEPENDDDDALIQGLLDQTEAAFLAAIHRTERPFLASEVSKIEILDATGRMTLFVAYPVKAVTLITLGYDPAAWVESIDATDVKKVTWQAGSARITRVDGGRFGCAGWPNYVRVTYTAQAEVPDDVALAITRVVAALYREAGVPESTAERTLTDTQELPTVADRDPVWQAAVAAHWEPRL